MKVEDRCHDDEIADSHAAHARDEVALFAKRVAGLAHPATWRSDIQALASTYEQSDTGEEQEESNAEA